MWAILVYTDTLDFSDLDVASHPDGSPCLFSSLEEARNFGEEELNGVKRYIEL